MLKDTLCLLRKEVKKTQLDMAQIFNISRAAYGSYEQGTREPDMAMLQKMANYFNVTTDYLLSGQELPIHDESTKNRNVVTAIGRGGDRATYELTDDEAELVKSLLDKISKKK